MGERAKGIEKPSKPSEKQTIGRLVLIKIKINTTFDICNDEVADFNDYQNFYILKDDKDKKYYHWLKELSEEDKNGKLKFLDGRIPFTLHSEQDFEFEAIFKVIGGDIDKITIKAISNSEYKFESQEKNNLKEGNEIPLTFKDTKQPYKGAIQYFENFNLIFDFTDAKCPRQIAVFRLYLTWKKPLWDNFFDNGKQKTTMKIKFMPNENKKCIIETLLWLGCKYSIGKGKGGSTDDENKKEILDAIFKPFSDKKVVRAREGKYERNWTEEGLGYWRGISAVDAQDKLPISERNPYFFYDPEKGHISRDFRIVVFQYGEFRCGEWAMFLQHILWAQNIETSQLSIYSGIGFNQSYYKSHILYKEISPEELEFYYANREFYVKDDKWTFSSKGPILAPSTTNRAQGNKNPLHQFMDHVFCILGDNRSWYDPSYGSKSKKYFNNSKDILVDYSKEALHGIGYYEFKNKLYKTITSNLNNHLIRESDIEGKFSKGVIAVIDKNGKTISTF